MAAKGELVACQFDCRQGRSAKPSARFQHPAATCQKNAVELRRNDEGGVRGRCQLSEGLLLVGCSNAQASRLVMIATTAFIHEGDDLDSRCAAEVFKESREHGASLGLERSCHAAGTGVLVDEDSHCCSRLAAALKAVSEHPWKNYCSPAAPAEDWTALPVGTGWCRQRAAPIRADPLE